MKLKPTKNKQRKLLVNSKLKHNYLLKATIPFIAPKYISRDISDNIATYTRKKEGYVNVYTIDNNSGLNRISEIKHTKSRRWIKSRKKRNLTALKELQKNVLVSQGGSLILQKEAVTIKAKLQEQFAIKMPLSFQIKTNNSYLFNTQNFFRSLKLKPYRFFYILKPLKGGFKAFSSGALGFLPRKQGLLLFKKMARLHTLNVKRHWKLQIVKKAANLIKKFIVNRQKIPTPIFCNQFKNFKLKYTIKGFYKKQKLSGIKVKLGKRRIRSKLKFIFILFKTKDRKYIKYNQNKTC